MSFRSAPPAPAPGVPSGSPREEARLRKQILRQAVNENVDTIAGRRPARPTASAERPASRGWAAAGVLIVAALATGAFAWVGRDSNAMVPANATAMAAAEGPRGVPLHAVVPDRSPAELLAGGAPPAIDSSVFPVEVRRIVIDPGHGGKDVGTLTPEGLYEKDIALDIALRLRDLLAAEPGGPEILLTRENDETLVLRDRARMANEAQADLFLSIHVNSLAPASLRGVETFYLGPTEDPFLVQLTSRENHESGYSLADVRQLLDGIYLDLRQEQSKQFAAAVQSRLHRHLGDEAGFADRGIKPAPFLVLVTTEMPAILAEVSCLSNPVEARRLGTPEYRQTIAEALREGIRAYTSGLSQTARTGAGGDQEG